MRTTTFVVKGMTCGHCVASVRDEVSQLDGVMAVDVQLETGVVRVESHEPVDSARVEAAVREAGYELVQ